VLACAAEVHLGNELAKEAEGGIVCEFWGGGECVYCVYHAVGTAGGDVE